MAFKKTELNDYCQMNKIPMEGYDTRQTRNGFVSSLRCGSILFRSSGSHPTKKSAENDVASVALRELRSRDPVDPKSGQVSEAIDETEAFAAQTSQNFGPTPAQYFPPSPNKNFGVTPPQVPSPVKDTVPCTAVPTGLKSDYERVNQLLIRYCHLNQIPIWHKVSNNGSNRHSAMVRIGDREYSDSNEHPSFDEAKYSVNMLAMKELRVEEFLRQAAGQMPPVMMAPHYIQQPLPTNITHLPNNPGPLPYYTQPVMAPASVGSHPVVGATANRQYKDNSPPVNSSSDGLLISRGGNDGTFVPNQRVQLDGSMDTPVSDESIVSVSWNQGVLLTPDAFIQAANTTSKPILSNHEQSIASKSNVSTITPHVNVTSKPISSTHSSVVPPGSTAPPPLPPVTLPSPTSSLTIPSFPASLPLPTRNNARKKRNNVESPTEQFKPPLNSSPSSLMASASIPQASNNHGATSLNIITSHSFPVSVPSHSHSPPVPMEETGGGGTVEMYYKQVLNDYVQKQRLPLPLFTTEYPENSLGYIGIVTLGGVEYRSPPDKNKKRALNLAAREALVSHGVIRDAEPPQPSVQSNVSYKNILQEYYQKNKYPMPQYSTVGVGNGKFVCSLTCTVSHGSRQVTFKGIECTTKKLAEQSAAETACIALGLKNS